MIESGLFWRACRLKNSEPQAPLQRQRSSGLRIRTRLIKPPATIPTTSRERRPASSLRLSTARSHAPQRLRLHKMMSASYLRSARGLTRLAQRTFTTTARQLESKAVTPTSTESPVAKKESQAPAELPQAPNRKEIWSRSQRPRDVAMTGPRFEQTDFDLQVRTSL